METVAPLLEGVFRGTERVYILTTSRESLRVEGEHVHRLAPLDCPPVGASLNAPEALSYSAVKLFVERAAASRKSRRAQQLGGITGRRDLSQTRRHRPRDRVCGKPR